MRDVRIIWLRIIIKIFFLVKFELKLNVFKVTKIWIKRIENKNVVQFSEKKLIGQTKVKK